MPELINAFIRGGGRGRGVHMYPTAWYAIERGEGVDGLHIISIAKACL